MLNFTFLIATTTADIPQHALGINLADPALAAACREGNVSGRHGRGVRRANYACPERWPAKTQRGDQLARWDDRAAVDIVTKEGIPVSPSCVVALVAQHPDLDSVAAMAAMALQWTPAWPRGEKDLEHNAVMARVHMIAQGAHAGLVPLHTLSQDFALPLPTRVAVVAGWLLGGVAPTRPQLDAAAQATGAARAALTEALAGAAAAVAA